MNCPDCTTQMRVNDSRLLPDSKVRRVRVCPQCGGRFATLEQIARRATVGAAPVAKTLSQKQERAARAAVAEQLRALAEQLETQGL